MDLWSRGQRLVVGAIAAGLLACSSGRVGASGDAGDFTDASAEASTSDAAPPAADAGGDAGAPLDAAGVAYCNPTKKVLIPFCDPAMPVVCAKADGGPDIEGSTPPTCPPPPWCPPPEQSPSCSVCGASPLYQSCFVWATADLTPVPLGSPDGGWQPGQILEVQ